MLIALFVVANIAISKAQTATPARATTTTEVKMKAGDDNEKPCCKKMKAEGKAACCKTATAEKKCPMEGTPECPKNKKSCCKDKKEVSTTEKAACSKTAAVKGGCCKSKTEVSK